MKTVNPERLIALVSGFVPMTLLIVGLSAPNSGVPRSAHSQLVGQGLTRPVRVAGPGCTMDMNPRLHIEPLIHDMITTAVSIADRL